MPGRFGRGTDEFTRIVAFSDAVFAIAMTLLVVSIDVPRLVHDASETELLHALRRSWPDLFSFGLSFAVIGRYWLAHHDFFSRLKGADHRLLVANLVYLGGIALLPFPTALIGEYFANAVAVATYALVVSFVSGMEVVMIVVARGAKLERLPQSDAMHRWSITAASVPVACFGASIPLAFADTKLAALAWLASVPVGMLVDRRRPEKDAQDAAAA